MTITPYDPLPGVLVIDPEVHADERGTFAELWSAERCAAAGLPALVQDNLSSSRRGTVRGLHWQWRVPQGKLVSVIHGAAWDVGVDVRRGSPTFGKHGAFLLGGLDRRQVWWPAGFAHGFQALMDGTLFFYKTSAPYDAGGEAAALWSDADIGIKWPLMAEAVVSQKDAGAVRLRDVAVERLLTFAGG